MKQHIDFNELKKGLFKENPTFVIVLGMCPTLAVTTQVINAVSMGLGVLFVLLFSNIFIFRNTIYYRFNRFCHIFSWTI